MTKLKKRLITLLISLGLILSGLIISTPKVFSDPQEPQCVCAECNYACGSGHASNCSYKPK